MENNLIYNHFRLEDLKNVASLDKINDISRNIDEVFFFDYSEKRSEILKEKIIEVIKLIDENLNNPNVLTKQEISFLYFIKSLCLDKLPEYSKVAEDSANKSLKLNPFNADNYNCIAHIIWKKGDIPTAISYYEKALQLDANNKRTLRFLSMIVRSKQSETIEDKKQLSKLSLEYSKRALTSDLKDSESWYVYGNAFFFKAFVESTQYDDLKSSVNAYSKAEKLQGKFLNPDLFYNRGVVYTYLEQYSEAHQDFLKADSIDSSLKAYNLAENIQTMVIQTYKFIKNQCTIKPKKLSQITNSIPTNLNENISYTLGLVEHLIVGENKTKLISAKIIQPISKTFEVPLY